MDQGTLVEMQVKEGQWLIDQLVREGVEITAAAWIKESESDMWYLYLATPLVGEDAPTRPVYGRVNEVIRAMQRAGFWPDGFDIKLIGSHNPIAIDMVAHRNSHPAPIPTRFRGARLGPLPVEAAYIYPPTDRVVKPSKLPNAERNLVAELESQGINIVIRMLGADHFECRARYKDGRDSLVAYGQTPEQAVQQTADNVRRVWTDLFQLSSS
jgi:hypothetical protein